MPADFDDAEMADRADDIGDELADREASLFRLRKVCEVMGMVAEDAGRDAMCLDGQPFDGAHVAVMLGQILAMVQATAQAVKLIGDELIAGRR